MKVSCIYTAPAAKTLVACKVIRTLVEFERTIWVNLFLCMLVFNDETYREYLPTVAGKMTCIMSYLIIKTEVYM